MMIYITRVGILKSLTLIQYLSGSRSPGSLLIYLIFLRADPLMLSVHLLLHGHTLDLSNAGLEEFVDSLLFLGWNISERERIVVEIGLYMISRGYSSLKDLFSLCAERGIDLPDNAEGRFDILISCRAGIDPPTIPPQVKEGQLSVLAGSVITYLVHVCDFESALIMFKTVSSCGIFAHKSMYRYATSKMITYHDLSSARRMALLSYKAFKSSELFTRVIQEHKCVDEVSCLVVFIRDIKKDSRFDDVSNGIPMSVHADFAVNVLKRHCSQLIIDLVKSSDPTNALKIYRKALYPLSELPNGTARRLLVASLPFESAFPLLKVFFNLRNPLPMKPLIALLKNVVDEMDLAPWSDWTYVAPVIERIVGDEKPTLQLAGLMVQMYCIGRNPDRAFEYAKDCIGVEGMQVSMYGMIIKAFLKESRLDDAISTNVLLESRGFKSYLVKENIAVLEMFVGYFSRKDNLPEALSYIEQAEFLAKTSPFLNLLDKSYSYLLRAFTTEKSHLKRLRFYYSRIHSPDWKMNWLYMQALYAIEEYAEARAWACGRDLGYFGTLTLAHSSAKLGIPFNIIVSEFIEAGFDLLPRNYDELMLACACKSNDLPGIMDCWARCFGRDMSVGYKPSRLRLYRGNDVVSGGYEEFGMNGYADFGVDAVFLSVFIDGIAAAGGKEELERVWRDVVGSGYPLNPNHWTSYYEALIRVGIKDALVNEFKAVEAKMVSSKMVRRVG
jgi:hypothetical protein